jgi:hypothetical protein
MHTKSKVIGGSLLTAAAAAGALALTVPAHASTAGYPTPTPTPTVVVPTVTPTPTPVPFPNPFRGCYRATDDEWIVAPGHRPVFRAEAAIVCPGPFGPVVYLIQR